MKELQKIKIRMESTNQYGDKFVIEQEVDEDYCDMGEMEIYHNAYLNFLKAVGFCFNLNDEVVVLSDDEHIKCDCEDECYEDEYCEDILCDGDCENCDIDY